MLNPSRRPLVLCVDDEPELLRGMTLHLARHYEVRTADSGAEGLELLRNEPHAAAIISDMRMPGMSGADFLARSLAIAPDAQRILLTGNVDLTSAIAAVNEGQIFRFLMKPCPPPDLLQAVQDAVTRFQSRDLERTAARRRVEHHQLQTDPLTGLGSRQKLMATLEAAAYDSAGDAWQRAVLFVDIDSSDEPLKDHDQPWGDEVARLIADRLRQCASPGAEMTRWGPDQFVVLVKSAACTDDELLRRAANKVNALTAPIPVDRYHVNIGASIGVARLRDRLEWQKLVQQGATAAREARGAGPGSVRLFRGDVPAAADQQRALLHELRKALRDGGLQVHYQPIVDVRKGRVHSLEALVRWNHPILGSIPPSTFIPLIETTGDIVDLGRWVLQAACVEAAELVREERPPKRWKSN
jgi:diguanylate cyclase (GGDEF)-like protein